jgi:hypothetical protein
MLNKLTWFINRARTISLAEWGYRIKQQLAIKKEQLLPHTPAGKLTGIKLPASFKFDDFATVKPFDNNFKFFAYNINVAEPINFHLDVSSGKSFPMTYSKKINMRSDAFGSAKVVWEVNRLQFCLPMLLDYKRTKNVDILNRFVAITTDWDNQNPYLKGVNWYSNIEVNIRLINWYWCWLILADDETFLKGEDYKKFRDDVWLPLIYKHCYYSYHNPSFYSSANNHLISEYAGLFIANCLWKFTESEKWLKYAKAGLEKEIVLQHSPNGINKEEAAEYIQFITDFFLLSYVSGQHYGVEFSAVYNDHLRNITEYIYQFLDARDNFPKYGDEDDGRLILPDGDTHSNNFVSILNTGSILFKNEQWKRPGAEFDVKTALLTAHCNGLQVWEKLKTVPLPHMPLFYPQEGHFYFKGATQAGKEVYAHFDAADLGFLSIAAHGHADALSFFLNIDGFPFIVDPGTFTYHTHPEWRKYFISTAAHNTISINNANQAKQAGPTMWLQHYTCKVLESKITAESQKVKASHNGYKKMGVEHTRTMDYVVGEQKFILEDQLNITGVQDTVVKQFFHLHPKVQLTKREDALYELSRPGDVNEKILLHLDPTLQWTLVVADENSPAGWYSPSFMAKQKGKVLIGTTNIQASTNYKTFIEIK